MQESFILNSDFDHVEIFPGVTLLFSLVNILHLIILFYSFDTLVIFSHCIPDWWTVLWKVTLFGCIVLRKSTQTGWCKDSGLLGRYIPIEDGNIGQNGLSTGSHCHTQPLWSLTHKTTFLHNFTSSVEPKASIEMPVSRHDSIRPHCVNFLSKS